MSTRCTAKARTGMVALAVAAGLAIGATGCGGGEDDNKSDSPASVYHKSGSHASAQEGKSAQPIAELKGPNGLLLQIANAKRDSGGFVTVNGLLKNDGSQVANVPAQLTGDETEILRHGVSLGGATLVDSKSKKRYYVLRDTDGRPLTTTGFPALKAGQSVGVFIQFPAPPASTTEVTFQLPQFPSAPLQITG